MKRKKLLIVLIAVIVIGFSGYCFWVGEEVKQAIVYAGVDSKGNPQDISAIITVIVYTAYLQENPGKELPKICETGQLECINQLSPAQKVKEACADAFKKIKEMTARIKNENSVVLGLNNLVSNAQSAIFCPQPEKNEVGIMDISSFTRDKCSEKFASYGITESLNGIDNCVGELNAFKKQNAE